jgi:hypothetical protein
MKPSITVKTPTRVLFAMALDIALLKHAENRGVNIGSLFSRTQDRYYNPGFKLALINAVEDDDSSVYVTYHAPCELFMIKRQTPSPANAELMPVPKAKAPPNLRSLRSSRQLASSTFHIPLCVHAYKGLSLKEMVNC